MHIEETSYRDLAMNQLTPAQQDFIMNTLRRGKRSAWLTIMAEMKGIVILPGDDEETIAQKVGGWILERFDDLGSRTGKCECRQSIRYVYHVSNVETNYTYSLGSTCIQTYTGLDSKTVDAIIKGMKVFDLEKEEILKKVINDWSLPFSIPSGMEIPEDIRQHLELELPLLDRQEARLKKLIKAYHEEKRKQLTPNEEESDRQHAAATEKCLQFDLFSSMEEVSVVTYTKKNISGSQTSGPITNKEVPNLYVIPDTWKAVIQDKLLALKNEGQKHVTSLMMANYIAKVFGHEQDRYLTGKPRTYYLVAIYMDRLSTLEVLDASQENITYKIL